MASNSHIFIILRLAVVLLVLNAWTCKGSFDEEAIKKSCKPWETFGCVSGSPACGENECGVEKRHLSCTKDCSYWMLV
ncbi:hypothetical protein MRX96_022977 [Rhipicephalus microplus]